ncbi:MAG: hypothetical protein V3S34_01085 [Hyphomicrobium sp.]
MTGKSRETLSAAEGQSTERSQGAEGRHGEVEKEGSEGQEEEIGRKPEYSANTQEAI